MWNGVTESLLAGADSQITFGTVVQIFICGQLFPLTSGQMTLGANGFQLTFSGPVGQISKTLRAGGSHHHSRKRPGVRQTSGAFPPPQNVNRR